MMPAQDGLWLHQQHCVSPTTHDASQQDHPGLLLLIRGIVVRVQGDESHEVSFAEGEGSNLLTEAYDVDS